MEGTRFQTIEAALKDNDSQVNKLFEQQSLTTSDVSSLKTSVHKLEQQIQNISAGV